MTERHDAVCGGLAGSACGETRAAHRRCTAPALAMPRKGAGDERKKGAAGGGAVMAKGRAAFSRC